MLLWRGPSSGWWYPLGLASSTSPLAAVDPLRLSQGLPSELAVGGLLFSFCSRILLLHTRVPLADTRNSRLLLSPTGLLGTSRRPHVRYSPWGDKRMLTPAHLLRHFPLPMIVYCSWTAWTECVCACVCAHVYRHMYVIYVLGEQWREGEMKAPA